MENLLNKKANHFIGNHNSHERIGKIVFSVEFLTDCKKDILDEINKCIEVLYSKYEENLGRWHMIGISDDFNLIHRDAEIPEYKILTYLTPLSFTIKKT